MNTATAITHPYKDHYMESAFLAFVSSASKNLLEEYAAETGQPKLGTTAIDRMIDKATGQDVLEAQRFIDWCVVQFGTPDQIGAEE